MSQRGNNPRRARQTDDETPTIGGQRPHPEGYNDGLRETLRSNMNDACRRDYRNRNQRVIKFWDEHDPEYVADGGVVDLRDEDINDEDKYHFGNTRDIKYAGLNHVNLLNFFVNNIRHPPTEKYPKGKLKSKEDIRKYKNAIEWGAEMAGERLSSKCIEEMDKFVRSYRKQHTDAKKKGEIDDNSADPIPLPLFKLICLWALQENNMFVWFWTIAQWNFVARSASIDPLKLSNFRVGTDSIIGKYDETKADKAGERLSEKNIYAQTFDWKICFWTSFGVWLALRVDEMKNGNQKIFLNGTAADGTASTLYCEQVSTIAQRHLPEVQQHMEGDRFNPYGFRKGSATYVVACTTNPPSLPSIARRGEWTIGSVLDVYWHFGSEQDQYLGRILADFDPNLDNFDTLPPHWKLSDPMSDPDIEKAMKMTFGQLLETHADHIPLFLRLLACIIYHSADMIEFMLECQDDDRFGGHDFTKLAVLHDTTLRQRLLEKVTTEPTPGVIEKATGIPPHVNQLRELATIRDRLNTLCEVVSNQTTLLVAAVKEAIESQVFQNGQVSRQQLVDVMTEYKKDTLDKMQEKLDEFKQYFQNQSPTNNQPPPPPPPPGQSTGGDFWYSDGSGQVKLHYVPQNFQFPSRPTLREGLRLWLLGQTLSSDGSAFVRPFRRFKVNGQVRGIYTKNLRDVYKNQWGIFEWIEKNIDTPIPQNPSDPDQLNDYFEKCIELLKKRVSYCFQGANDPIAKYTIGTWTNNITMFLCVMNKHKCWPFFTHKRVSRTSKNNYQSA
jgi:hypothetical protein